MRDCAVIPIRSFKGKTRLGVEKGGILSLTQRENLIKALILDSYDVLKESGSLEKIYMGTNNKEVLKFCKENSIDTLIVQGTGINEQFKFIADYTFKQKYDLLLLIASDLPFITEEYVQAVVSKTEELYNKYQKAVVINPSKRLGCATVCVAPPNLIYVEVDVPNIPNFITQINKLREIPFSINADFCGYIDIDLLEDLIEVGTLIKFLPQYHKRRVFEVLQEFGL